MKTALVIAWKPIQWILIKLLIGLLYLLTKGSVKVVGVTAKGALKVGKMHITRVRA